jgi:hypothetical protein
VAQREDALAGWEMGTCRRFQIAEHEGHPSGGTATPGCLGLNALLVMWSPPAPRRSWWPRRLRKGSCGSPRVHRRDLRRDNRAVDLPCRGRRNRVHSVRVPPQSRPGARPTRGRRIPDLNTDKNRAAGLSDRWLAAAPIRLHTPLPLQAPLSPYVGQVWTQNSKPRTPRIASRTRHEGVRLPGLALARDRDPDGRAP